MCDEASVGRLIASTQPDEIYNLAGQSSVSASFAQPTESWRSNADAVAVLLEAIRREAPAARLYQSSSGEMFGSAPDGAPSHSEASPYRPQSPYAAAKTAAHLLCAAYRDAFGLRIACGILFNHESHRRSNGFLTRKVVDHVKRLRGADAAADIQPLRIGNPAVQRDWGFAPEYVAGMLAILRQVSVRARLGGGPPEPDVAASYRDYVLATGRLHAVWQLVDGAFGLAGIELAWDRSSPDPLEWHARFRTNDRLAVVVDPALLRPSDPLSIAADPSRAERELGWSPSRALDTLLADMLEGDSHEPS